jgi:hypothetical protein
MTRLALVLCASLLATSLASAEPVLLCWASGTPTTGMSVPAEQVDAITMPTPTEFNGRTVAKRLADALARRGIATESFDLRTRQPSLKQWSGSTIVVVAPVYHGGVHWAVKKLIDDRNGALYYAKAGRAPRRAAVLLLAESGTKVLGAMGDLNSAGSPFPGGADRLDRILEVGDPNGITAAIADAVGHVTPAAP